MHSHTPARLRPIFHMSYISRYNFTGWELKGSSMLMFPSGSSLLSRMELLATVYVIGKLFWSSSCPPGSLALPAITIISGSNLTVADACMKTKVPINYSSILVSILTEDSWDEKKKRAFTEVEWLKWSRPSRGIDILCPGQALNCMIKTSDTFIISCSSCIESNKDSLWTT